MFFGQKFEKLIFLIFVEFLGEFFGDVLQSLPFRLWQNENADEDVDDTHRSVKPHRALLKI
jgi:hypothetical protein